MKRRRQWRRFLAWTRRARLNRALTGGLFAASVLAVMATFATMSGNPALFGSDFGVVVGLLYVDAILLLLTGLVLARPLTRVWMARRRGRAGSRLHMRLVLMFSLAAVLPAVVVAVFSGVFLNFGIQSWFGERVGTVVGNSRAVAHAYLEEHQKAIRADILAMANDINREAPYLAGNSTRFNRFLEAQAALRELTEAVVIDGSGEVLARTALSLSLSLEAIPLESLRQAAIGEVVLLAVESDDRVRALVQLDRFVDSYLLVGRFVDPEVLVYIDRTEGAYREYKDVEKRRRGMQITFVLVFAVLALLLLLVSIRVGLLLASSLAQPISGLIGAAERIRRGDLAARVEGATTADEVGTLGRVFNRMAGQLESQQRGLIEANRELDERRRFTETVLTGVSAGVIGVDPDGAVSLLNRSAARLLAIDGDRVVGQGLTDVVPEMGDLLAQARLRPERMTQSELRVFPDGRARTFLVRIVAETIDHRVIGYVVTFDDITDLQNAQRQAAWADVARRIAHEIKNPLTPIQLSAERLKRKYLKQIADDPDTFTACTETIVRQVHDIGRMVDEFSSFARMPEPDMKPEDMTRLIKDIVFMERNRSEGVRFDLRVPETPLPVRCDPRQVRQALINVIKNAVEALLERPPGGEPPCIDIRASSRRDGEADSRIAIEIADNGPGLPIEGRDRLTEPYMTTRPKGTGLGLAIVRKIMEDHGGELILMDRPEGGTLVILVFHAVPSGAAAPAAPTGDREAMDVAVRLTTDGA